MRNERERLIGSDEIDLIELVQGVWRQKIWVGLVAVPVIALGLAYVMLVSPVYEAKLYVQPPSQIEIAQLNYGRGGDTGLAPFTSKDVYEIYLKALQSEAVRNKFFRNVFLLTLTDQERSGSRDALYGQYNSMLKVSQAGKNLPNRYVITANLNDPRLAATWVSRYAEMAEERAKAELVDGSQSDISIMADNLERDIRAAQASAMKQRTDRIAQLNEALRVAKSIGLEKPPIISDALATEVSAGMAGALTYMRGTKALEAEIANLKARASDDPFISGLRERQEKLAFLRDFKIDPSSIAMYQQDGGVEQPDEPIRPKKSVIVTISVVIGLIFGGIVALLRDVWIKRRHLG
ncbi:LPS O-antigen chain length determinant protein WzzB [Pseudomonas putida]|uniref:LPS O-antigen chain length determinant protein WzzB n=1 Tax=Pseudomonas putida TaxID=303 RepID=UPI0018AC69A7|nr:Wzz/FepE/Etk N-terminal domain-containing protein [Pseudomonas putida]MBF8669055.1 LPS O-antigen chain length determinant protein WzzB [Pseudomonas putida]MBF8711024.1 LPS O-antigen chain length determinant protein WzzB [Pseudomonas putida]